jgi:predicted DNA-binding WGR domain protein
MNVFCIELHACDPPRNCWRFYRIEAGQDLFGEWTVRLRYGRIGARGRLQNVIVTDEHEGRRVVRAYLTRRHSAPDRIGVPYQVQELFDPKHWTLQADVAANIPQA